MSFNAEMTTDQRETLPTLRAKDKNAEPLARGARQVIYAPPSNTSSNLCLMMLVAPLVQPTGSLDMPLEVSIEATLPRRKVLRRVHAGHTLTRGALRLRLQLQLQTRRPYRSWPFTALGLLPPRSLRPSLRAPGVSTHGVEQWLRNLLVHIGPMTQGGNPRRPVKSIFQPSEHVALWVAEEIRRDIPSEIVGRLIALGGPRPGDIVLLDFTNPPVPVASDQHGRPYAPIFQSVLEYNSYIEAYSRSLASKTPFVLTIEPTASQSASPSTDLSGVADLSSLTSTPSLAMDDSPALLPSVLESSPSPAPIDSGAQHFGETLHTPAEHMAGPVDGAERTTRSSQLLHGQVCFNEHSYPADQQSPDAMYSNQSNSSTTTVDAHYSFIHASEDNWSEGNWGSGLNSGSIWSVLQAALAAGISGPYVGVETMPAIGAPYTN
ncbi:hypothetical protein FRC12_022354 [Ceratobasidium sp. 428]|nr:hypothetical protein FRC12_022354 [Ceratobasidium sp. 428]